MNNQNLLFILIAAAATAFTAFSPAGADTDYYHSAAYQAEEQAFRARQDEGSRLTETYGSNSPQFLNWYAREKGTVVPQNNFAVNYSPYYQPYYGNLNQPYNQPYYANVNQPYNQPLYGNVNMYSSSFQYPAKHHRNHTR